MMPIKKEDKRTIKPRLVGKGEKIILINITESSLDTLRRRKTINYEQYYTALRYRRIWEKSRIGSFTCDFEAIGGNQWKDLSVDKIDAIAKLSRINGFVGEKTSQILSNVCIMDFTVKELAASLNRPRQYAGHRIREAIDEVRRFFENKY